MTQDDAYRKVGRGGAGNFHSKPAVDASPRDLEAQKPVGDASPSPVSLPSAPARAGRGGAGNFIDNTGSASEHERQVADQTTTAVRQQPARAPGLSGRGGAGNWKTDAPALEAKRTEEERGKGEELERKVREVVDQGLKMPEKVHTAVEKTKGP